MSSSAAQKMAPPAANFGFAGRALAQSAASNDNVPIANDNTPVANDNSPAPNETTVIKESPTTATGNLLLQTAVRILDRIDDTLQDQLQFDKYQAEQNREQFFERARATENETEKTGIEKVASERSGSGMSGMVAAIARGLGPALLAILPTILAGLGIAAGAGLAAKGIYDHADSIVKFGKKAGEGIKDVAVGTYEGAKDVAVGTYEGAKSAVGTIAGALGFATKKYESGSRGVSTISTPGKDPGGKSYGTYQLSSKAGTLRTYLNQSGYARQFSGLTVGSREFDQKWRQLAKNDPKFAESQHDFIRKTHYEPALAHAKKLGFDVTDRRIQEAIWSGSIQHSGINKILNTTAKMIDVRHSSPEDVVKAFYKARGDYSYRNVLRNSGDAKYARDASYGRYNREVKDVLRLQASSPQAAPAPVRQFRSAQTPKVSQVRSRTTAQNTPAPASTNTTVVQKSPAPQRVAQATPTPSPGRPGSDISYGMYYQAHQV